MLAAGRSTCVGERRIFSSAGKSVKTITQVAARPAATQMPISRIGRMSEIASAANPAAVAKIDAERDQERDERPAGAIEGDIEHDDERREDEEVRERRALGLVEVDVHVRLAESVQSVDRPVLGLDAGDGLVDLAQQLQSVGAVVD